jgi:hypothetical protein
MIEKKRGHKKEGVYRDDKKAFLFRRRWMCVVDVFGRMLSLE